MRRLKVYFMILLSCVLVAQIAGTITNPGFKSGNIRAGLAEFDSMRVDGSPLMRLPDLKDVDTTLVSDNDALLYDKATNTFDFGASGGGLPLADIPDSLANYGIVKESGKDIFSSQYDEGNTGFVEWTSGSSAATYTVDGTGFQIDRAGSGYIRGELITWAALTKTGALDANETNYIFIDRNGDAQFTADDEDTLYVENVVLFECLYDGTNYVTVKENHGYDTDTQISWYLHHNAGTVIRDTGAVITRVASGTGAAADDRRLKTVGADFLDDRGLTTDIPALNPIVINMYFTNGAGKWVLDSSASEFIMEYDNAGTMTAMSNGEYSVNTIYVSKDDIESALPTYYAVMGDAVYANRTQAVAAIAAGNTPRATNELNDLEFAQLGYCVMLDNADGGYIYEVNVSKSVFNTQFIGGGVGDSHSLLQDLDNDDHTQYLLRADTEDSTVSFLARGSIAIGSVDITNPSINHLLVGAAEDTTRIAYIAHSGTGSIPKASFFVRHPTTGVFTKRTLQGTTNEIQITNATGSVADPTISLPDSTVVPKFSAESYYTPTPTGLSAGEYFALSTTTLTAGYTSTAVGDVVYLASTGKLLGADSDATLSTKAFLGIALEIKDDTEACLIMTEGYINIAAWTSLEDSLGLPIYVGTTAGLPVVDVPSSGETLRVIGSVIAEDIIYFKGGTGIWTEVK